MHVGGILYISRTTKPNVKCASFYVPIEQRTATPETISNTIATIYSRASYVVSSTWLLTKLWVDIDHLLGHLLQWLGAWLSKRDINLWCLGIWRQKHGVPMLICFLLWLSVSPPLCTQWHCTLAFYNMKARKKMFWMHANVLCHLPVALFVYNYSILNGLRIHSWMDQGIQWWNVELHLWTNTLFFDPVMVYCRVHRAYTLSPTCPPLSPRKPEHTVTRVFAQIITGLCDQEA